MWSIVSNALKLPDATDAESDTPNTDMCSQCKVDLSAYEEHIQALMADLEDTEKDVEERTNVIRSWKKKAVYMQKLVGHLEEDEERKRRKTAERHARDAALDEELRQMHERISQLNRETNNVKYERDTLIQAVEKGEEMIAMLERELMLRDEVRKGGKEGKKNIELKGLEAKDDQKNSDVKDEQDTLIQVVEKAKKKIAMLEGELALRDKELHMKDEANAMLEKKLSMKDEINVEAVLQTEREMKEELDSAKMELDRLSSENSRLQAQVQRIQRENASMEITLAQRNKQIEHYRDDITGLNIALDSKQQEVQLVKRKYNIRKIAGPTPPRPTAAPSTISQPPAKSRRLLSMQLSDTEKENRKQ